MKVQLSFIYLWESESEVLELLKNMGSTGPVNITVIKEGENFKWMTLECGSVADAKTCLEAIKHL